MYGNDSFTTGNLTYSHQYTIYDWNSIKWIHMFCSDYMGVITVYNMLCHRNNT